MGFQGELNSVSLGDLFQTLHMNHQTGTLTVGGGGDDEPEIHIWFDQGLVAGCTAPPVEGRPFLVHTLLRRGILPGDVGEEVVRRLRATDQAARDLLLAMNAVADEALDEVSAWCIEETVCPLFDRRDGSFRFTDGDPVPEMAGSRTLWMGARMQTPQLVLEATRRRDEWERIREVIPDDGALYAIDDDGRANLRSVQTDPEMLRIIRLLDGRHGLDEISRQVGTTRFDTFAIVAQLVMAGVAKPRTQQDVVDDALDLIRQGDVAKARDLLEAVARTARVAEVLRPLAEVSTQLKQIPRAVELYLELIQISQDAGDLETALGDLDTIIGLSPDDPDLLFERAQVQSELGRIEESAENFVLAAQAFLAVKNAERALDACHRAKNLMPRSPEPHRYLAKAFLMEGLTDNAVVEYKALWHALLTNGRPVKALDQLRGILEADCKYPAVKDQVIAHAQSSEAVKTGRAVRALVYAALGLVLVAAGFAGWEYWQREVTTNRGRDEVQAVQNEFERSKDSLPHAGLLATMGEILQTYGANKEIAAQAKVVAQLIRDDFEARAKDVLDQSQVQMRASQFDRAEASLIKLKKDYAGTRAAAVADARLDELRSTKIGVEVLAVVAQARRQWEDLDWDGAIDRLKPVLARADLPLDMKNEYAALHLQWSNARTSASDLLGRAELIRARGDRRATVAALRTAAAGRGDGLANAQLALAKAEVELIDELAGRLTAAAAAGDDAAVFAAVEEIIGIADRSQAAQVRERSLAVELPFTLTVDHPRTTLRIAAPGQEPRRIAAPADAAGRWTHRFAYRLGETVAVEASRVGFSPAALTIAAANRRTAAAIVLVRGPRWSMPLSGVPTAPPIAHRRTLLIGTDHNTIDTVDPALSSGRPIVFGDAVSPIRLAPVVHAERILAVVDGAVVGVDASTRTPLWSWPPVGSRIQISGPLCAHDHELLPGQMVVFAGAGRSLAIMAVDAAGAVSPYPAFELPGELTARPFVERSDLQARLFLPMTGQIQVLEIGKITERNPPTRLLAIRTPGDPVGLPVRARAAGKPAVLYADNSGQVLAIDPTLGGDDPARPIAAWTLAGSAPSTPVVDEATAYVAVAEGRIYAIDLDRPGAIRWSYPPSGTALAPLSGAIARGRNGIYAADANGNLLCIDAQRGTLRWRADLPGSAPVGVAAIDGQVLVGIRQRSSPPSGLLAAFDEGAD